MASAGIYQFSKIDNARKCRRAAYPSSGVAADEAATLNTSAGYPVTSPTPSSARGAIFLSRGSGAVVSASNGQMATAETTRVCGTTACAGCDCHALQSAALDKIWTELKKLTEAVMLKDRKIFTVAEAAKYADVQPGTVRRWLETGALKGTKVSNHKQARWRIRRRDLDVFLERNVNQSSLSPQP